MAKAKTTLIELTANDIRRKFEISHAEKILSMPNNGGWVLPDDSKYVFDKKDGIRTRPNSGNTQSTGKDADDK